MKFKILFTALTLLGGLCSQVNATVNTQSHVGSYNLILKNDLQTNAEVEGSAYIGGNINGNTIVFGAALSSETNVDAVTVVGNISPKLTIQNGHNAVYGGTSANGFNLNGGGSATNVTQSTLASEFNSIYDQVISDSNYFAGLETNGSFDGSDQNNKLITANETSGLNVININASDLSNGGELDLAQIPDVPVVVNVIGGGDIVITTKIGNKGAGLQGDSLASLVLWNFNTATSISFQGDGWVGSILAPYADVSSSTGHLEGALAAKSYSGNVELHNSLFAYTPDTSTTTPTEVPAPTGLALMGLGLLFITRRQFKK
ncbi:MAG: choice-of-anchor A family protein [Paraglaciecola sp.]|uniref:choice-of-anchor A family protein n=1 Tax=Paraglaciecola sp. TaxID=1920173 RepID=UPI0032992D3A